MSHYTDPDPEPKRRKTRRDRAIEEGIISAIVERPPAYPIEEATESAHAPEPDDPASDPAQILQACPDAHPHQPTALDTDFEEVHRQQEDTEQPGQPRDHASGQQPASNSVSATATDHATATATATEPLVIAGRTQLAGDDLARTQQLAPAAAVPEALHDPLKRLPQWQARYVLALMEYGGIITLALKKANVSRETVEKFQSNSPEFARCCADALSHSTDLVEAALFKGATVGDLTPIYQGGFLVGYKRVRSVKDAELLLKLRGKLDAPDDPAAARKSAGCTTVAPEAVGQIVAGTLKSLFEARGRHLPPPSQP